MHTNINHGMQYDHLYSAESPLSASPIVGQPASHPSMTDPTAAALLAASPRSRIAQAFEQYNHHLTKRTDQGKIKIHAHANKPHQQSAQEFQDALQQAVQHANQQSSSHPSDHPRYTQSYTISPNPAAFDMNDISGGEFE